MANAQTAIFKFESVNPIRSIIIDGQPWFVAQDVCSALRIQNVTQALEKLDDDERSMFNIGHEHRAIFDSRVKEINIISESGLYTLILRCRDAVTPGTIPYRFRKWVTGEVLPQIRRTGSYIKNSLPQEERIKMVADQVANATASAVMQAIKLEDKKEYSAPLKPGYRSLIHSPSGVLGLTENSLLMNLLNQLQEDGHDVSGAAAELTTMFCYIVGVSKCLRDIQTHAEYINDKAGFF
ncbi:BRO-like protein [Escherichia coli]|uniref:BRO-N domain-containing protein n=3 Tax=Enterobacteriaceae TaxID=543 RepID=UPI00178CE02C|nr:BRO family protein [Escherichia coli]EGI9609240.1 BRO-like protein [Escherichia coli]EHM5901566.1 BRO-like protein [Escherichia coli]EIJ5151454.1 BRO-like protein [Escherichia coli]MBE1734460.1 BRO-like protein [Escherichia coli]MCN7344944.1 BRO-like protein [Escherichia coli]